MDQQNPTQNPPRALKLARPDHWHLWWRLSLPHLVVGIGAGLSALGVTASADDLLRVDERVDDGDLSSGVFQNLGGSRYTYIIEE